MRFARAIAAAAAGLAILAGCSGRSPVASTDAEQDAIRKAPPAWAEAFNAGDADAIAAKYWDDATIQPPHAPASTGRAAIRDHFAADIQNMKDAGMTLVIPEANAVEISGELGYGAGIYNVTDANGAVIDTGKFVNVFRKRENQWLLIRDIWNSDRPEAATPAPTPAPPD